jgi:hypothetical protein
MATVTNRGFGYVDAPTVTVGNVGCTTKPIATAVVWNGTVTRVNLTKGVCQKKPTLTINPPVIPAIGTIVKDANGKYTVNLSNKGAGYVTKPLITINAPRCNVTPNTIVTMDGDKVGNITLTGPIGLNSDFSCTTTPTIVIE